LRFNPYSAGDSSGSLRCQYARRYHLFVSILILLEIVLEVERLILNYGQVRTVSILILLEIVLEVNRR